MIDDRALDELQAALVELMSRRLATAEIAAVLATDPRFVDHHAWIGAFVPHLVASTSWLTEVWARRRR